MPGSHRTAVMSPWRGLENGKGMTALDAGAGKGHGARDDRMKADDRAPARKTPKGWNGLLIS